ncbi:monosaccharide ABC transporter ATP-binding protein, CUT2 family [Arboricoccus pini]|uniref:Monosaccharide ABC transporter ATP-binding protein, CUT2 family n=1 Tax=Arboricoccus pini TaxID=1963835 RepID=A0A212S0N7_9PROT|nr:sugar ABC transporter ATP-binding protein [Arboricoccus pini]SNB78633.1 monosaccharide ABC transporter ATP-binding protein, CUT2 family [Arboricoccus pini]
MDATYAQEGHRRPLLAAGGIVKRFGGTLALDRADLACFPREIHALHGANGAGKSTMVKILSGIFAPDTGTITLRGQPVSFANPREAASHGIGTVFQELSLFAHMTVAENVMIGREPTGLLGRIASGKLRRDVQILLERLKITHLDPDAMVADLSLADRQLVEIAKALAGDPGVLILDEGTSALAPREVDRLFAILRHLRLEGRAVIFISHRMAEARELVDRVTIFRNGQSVVTAPMQDLDDEAIVEHMLGRRVEQSFERKAGVPPSVTPLLRARGLTVADRIKDLDLTLEAGEVVGLGGREGQGQGDLLLALFGAYRRLGGRIECRGQPIRTGTPWRGKAAGIALIPEDRKVQGLLQPMGILPNLTLATLPRFARHGLINRGQEDALAGNLQDRLAIKAASLRLPVRSLSGGNQQKVVLAKWLATGADIFLFYDPTRGIDVGTKQSFYRLIEELAATGKAVLLYSTETAELVGLCHRVLVMNDGRITAELKGDGLSEAAIIQAGASAGVASPERALH